MIEILEAVTKGGSLNCDEVTAHLVAGGLVAQQLQVSEHDCQMMGDQHFETKCCLLHWTTGCHPKGRLLVWWKLETLAELARFDCPHLDRENSSKHLLCLMGCCSSYQTLALEPAGPYLSMQRKDKAP